MQTVAVDLPVRRRSDNLLRDQRRAQPDQLRQCDLGCAHAVAGHGLDRLRPARSSMLQSPRAGCSGRVRAQRPRLWWRSTATSAPSSSWRRVDWRHAHRRLFQSIATRSTLPRPARRPIVHRYRTGRGHPAEFVVIRITQKTAGPDLGLDSKRPAEPRTLRSIETMATKPTILPRPLPVDIRPAGGGFSRRACPTSPRHGDYRRALNCLQALAVRPDEPRTSSPKGLTDSMDPQLAQDGIRNPAS